MRSLVAALLITAGAASTVWAAPAVRPAAADDDQGPPPSGVLDPEGEQELETLPPPDPNPPPATGPPNSAPIGTPEAMSVTAAAFALALDTSDVTALAQDNTPPIPRPVSNR